MSLLPSECPNCGHLHPEHDFNENPGPVQAALARIRQDAQDAVDNWILPALQRLRVASLESESSPDDCQTCRGGGMHWSDSTFGSFGVACLTHRLFWWKPDGEENWKSMPLNQAHMPRAHRSIPAFREAAGWTGPTS